MKKSEQILRAVVAKKHQGRIIAKAFDGIECEGFRKAIKDCEDDGIGEHIHTGIHPIPDPSYIDWAKPYGEDLDRDYTAITQPPDK